jgi:predicted nucleic acid-binding protein
MFLVDTNVISELVKRQPNQGVLDWAARISEFDVSVITLEELQYGLARKPNTRIRMWIEQFIAERCGVLPVTEAIASACGTLRGGLASRGVVRTQADMMIAATAQVHQLTVVTGNHRDFDGCGVGVLNPFR